MNSSYYKTEATTREGPIAPLNFSLNLFTDFSVTKILITNDLRPEPTTQPPLVFSDQDVTSVPARHILETVYLNGL